MEARLQKVLAKYGIASRRRAEALIQAGRVCVNGQRATIGLKVDPERDAIAVDNQLLKTNKPARLYLLLNKPLGVVSTCRDPQGRVTILEGLPTRLTHNTGLHPIGRLDASSTGALILTNDGELTYQLSHPRHHVPKTYRVWVEGIPSPATLERWRSGIRLDNRLTLPARVELLQTRCQRRPHQAELEIVLIEGRNRQIRRVAQQLGYPVTALHRWAIGTITLQNKAGRSLPSGEYRHLKLAELEQLRHQARDTTSSDLSGM